MNRDVRCIREGITYKTVVFATLLICCILHFFLSSSAVASSLSNVVTGKGVVITKDDWSQLFIKDGTIQFTETEGVFVTFDVLGSSGVTQVKVSCTLDGEACNEPFRTFGIAEGVSGLFQLNFVPRGTHSVVITLFDQIDGEYQEVDSRILSFSVEAGAHADLAGAVSGNRLIMGDGMPPWRFDVEKQYHPTRLRRDMPLFTAVRLTNIIGCNKYQVKVGFRKGGKNIEGFSKEYDTQGLYKSEEYVWIAQPADSLEKGGYRRTISISYDGGPFTELKENGTKLFSIY